MLTNKIIDGYAWLKTRQLAIQNDKKGQTVMEYAVIFFVAGLGMAAALSLYQTRIEVSIYNQTDNLISAGRSLF